MVLFDLLRDGLSLNEEEPGERVISGHNPELEEEDGLGGANQLHPKVHCVLGELHTAPE